MNFNKKDIYRGIIGTLKNNGLINVFWASDTVYDAVITQAGRSYFERNNTSIKIILLMKF